MRESNFVALYGHYMLKRIPIDFIFNVNLQLANLQLGVANVHKFCARKSNDFSFAWNSNCFSNCFFQKKIRKSLVVLLLFAYFAIVILQSSTLGWISRGKNDK